MIIFINLVFIIAGCAALFFVNVTLKDDPSTSKRLTAYRISFIAFTAAALLTTLLCLSRGILFTLTIMIIISAVYMVYRIINHDVMSIQAIQSDLKFYWQQYTKLYQRLFH